MESCSSPSTIFLVVDFKKNFFSCFCDHLKKYWKAKFSCCFVVIFIAIRSTTKMEEDDDDKKEEEKEEKSEEGEEEGNEEGCSRVQ